MKSNVIPMNALITDSDLSYAEVFRQVFGYAILDYEPQKICEGCGKVLVQVSKLRQTAEKTQILLERVLKTKNVQQVKVEVDPESSMNECESALVVKNEVKKGSKSKVSRLVKSNIECEQCRRRFRTLDRLQSHHKSCKNRLSDDDNRSHDKTVCPVCGNLSTADHIRHHTKTMQNKDPAAHKTFICDICGITASTRSNIDMHMKVQHLNIRSNCRHCPGSFKNPSALARHMRKSHSEKLQAYKCRTCDFRTCVEKEARNHRESHRVKKLVCHECGQEFHKTINLRYHMASHSDLRPYACEVCGSAFKTTKALGAHKKTHKDYDYECPVCGRSYLTNQLMRSHVKKNHPEFELPPPGTVFSKSYRKKMAERKLREMAIKQGVEIGEVEAVVVPETVIHQVQSIHFVR